jgi:hypothetical protein
VNTVLYNYRRYQRGLPFICDLWDAQRGMINVFVGAPPLFFGSSQHPANFFQFGTINHIRDVSCCFENIFLF